MFAIYIDEFVANVEKDHEKAEGGVYNRLKLTYIGV
jgi:hypothetical protein